jgi:predicted transcriptional regulator of viral defense system
MIAKNRRPVVCGEVRVEFAARNDLAKTPVNDKNTPRGRMRVSSPEATALEIVGYADHCGGLDNVAGVLAELVEELDSAKLVSAARLSPIAWSQRLGYLLDLIKQRKFADALAAHVSERASAVALLVRAKPAGRAPRNKRWKLAVNASVEPDT